MGQVRIEGQYSDAILLAGNVYQSNLNFIISYALNITHTLDLHFPPLFSIFHSHDDYISLSLSIEWWCITSMLAHILLAIVPLSSAVLLEGPCQPIQEQTPASTAEMLRNVLHINLTLLPVVITEPDKEGFSIPFTDSTFMTSFRFTAEFGSGQCVDRFQLGVNADHGASMDFFVESSLIRAGNAFVENVSEEKDWLVYVCQNVNNGKGHVAHLWIVQRKSHITRNSMRMGTLMDKYWERIQELGLRRKDLLSLQDNEFEFCDEELQSQFNRFSRTLFWFRPVVLILIAIMLMITIAGFAIRFFNAASKLSKVRNFSATN